MVLLLSVAVACGVVVVKEALDLQEIIYEYPEIPTFWQVVYQEAIRGHHLLLLEDGSQESLSLTDLDGQADELTADNMVESMTNHITKIACLSDLTAIHRYLTALTKKEKFLLYRFYFQFLEDYKVHVRNSLN